MAESKTITRPAVMSGMIYGCIKQHAASLPLHLRRVMFCFDHFWYESCMGQGSKIFAAVELKEPPDHVIAMQIMFMEPAVYQNIGSIGYYDFTDRAIVAEAIKDTLSDIASSGIQVIGSVSSGKMEMKLVLGFMPMVRHNGCMSYMVDDIGFVTHIFDSSWLIRKVKELFCAKDFYVERGKEELQSSYKAFKHVFETMQGQNLFCDLDLGKDFASTSAAVRMFSHSTRIALEDYYDAQREGNETISPEEYEGTDFFLNLFDVLNDTFNSSHDRTYKMFRSFPLSRTSYHWQAWKEAIPVLMNMKFLDQAPLFYAERISQRVEKVQPNRQKKKKERKRQAKAAIKAEVPKSASTSQPVLSTPASVVPSYANQEFEESEALLVDHDQGGKKKRRKKKKKQEEKQEKIPVYPSEDEYRLPESREFDMKTHALLSMFKITAPVLEYPINYNHATSFGMVIKKLKNIVHRRYHRKNEHQDVWLALCDHTKWMDEFHDVLVEEHGNTMAYVYLATLYIDDLNSIFKYFDDTSLLNLECLRTTVEEVSKLLEYIVMPVNFMYFFTITGIQDIFNTIEDKPGDFLITKLLNCDNLHRSMELMRSFNSLPPKIVVESKGLGSVLNARLSGIVLAPEFRLSIVSTILDDLTSSEEESENSDGSDDSESEEDAELEDSGEDDELEDAEDKRNGDSPTSEDCREDAKHEDYGESAELKDCREHADDGEVAKCEKNEIRGKSASKRSDISDVSELLAILSGTIEPEDDEICEGRNESGNSDESDETEAILLSLQNLPRQNIFSVD